MNKPQTHKIDLINAEKLQDNAGFQQALDRDFGTATEGFSDGGDDGVSRRRWLQIMGASLALGGTVGCRFEEETIAPFAFRPQNRVPGVPEKFASMTEVDGVAQPVLATCYDGRPIKLDGNPDHADSLGASTAFTQGRVLELYDPDRLRGPMTAADGKFSESTKSDVDRAAQFLSATSLSNVAVLAGPTSSPSMLALKKKFEGQGGQWFTFAPVADDNQRAGTKQAFGQVLRPHYHLDKADVIVSLDADILGLHPATVVNSQRFAKGRDADNGKMSRLYVVESAYSTTGASADHRMSLPTSKIASFAASLADSVAKAEKGGKVELLPYRERVLAAMAQDLVDHPGKSLVVVGESQPPEVHAIAHSLNERLGNHGKTVTFTQPVDADRPGMLGSIEDFAGKIKSGAIKSVVIVGGNPVYSAPVELGLDSLLKSVTTSIHLTNYANETSACCNYLTNLADELAVWNDAIAYDGSVCVGQPLIRPLFDGRTAGEYLATWMGDENATSLSLVQTASGLSGDEWQQAVHDGFVADSAAEPVAVTMAEFTPPAADGRWLENNWTKDKPVEVMFCTSRSVYDGRHANNAWMQELPDFFTKISWDNVATMSPRTAREFGFAHRSTQGKILTLIVGDNEVKLPIAIQPGQAFGTIGLEIGYGRTLAGRVGGHVLNGVKPVGADVGPLRTIDNWNFSTDVEAIDSAGTYRLAVVQEPWEIDVTGRDEIQNRMFRNKDKKESDRSALIREGSFESYQQFLSHQETDSHTASKPKTTALPIINNVSFVVDEDTQKKADEEHGDDHSHGHESHSWPEAFHLHHQNVDITPGAREDYRWDKTTGAAWGMSIDLNKCTGCNACVIACQSENNIPVVGKSEVAKGREMAWIRIDRYFTGDDLNNPDEIFNQPIACVHCENAPCETVCPVNATTHGKEGTNDIAYNRCIGTRYCANNCPYKVRRFNFFDYAPSKFNGGLDPNYTSRQVAEKFDETAGEDRTFNQNLIPPRLRKKLDEISKMKFNPDVTVRSRGVIEKCTYCIQRVNAARQDVKVQGIWSEKDQVGPIPDGFFEVACQQACPTDAIAFGDILDPNSRVTSERDSHRTYALLGYLNTRPRTTHMMRVRNPNPAIRVYDLHDPLDHSGGHGDGHKAGSHGSDSHDEVHPNEDHDSGHDAPADSHGEAHSAVFTDSVKKYLDQGYSMSLKVIS